VTTSTLVITPLVTLAILVSGVLLARMLSGWRMGHHTRVDLEARDRIALYDEKVRLLTAVHDVDYEHELGKLSDEDHRTMRARFEAEAVAVIQELERL
jgi:hypothetical protein